MLGSFFIYELPPEVEKGVYQIPLVILSYMVASFASYTALSLAQQISIAKTSRERSFLLWGGAFAMGAGIWSMHFIGMLSYKMNMVVEYSPAMTLLSMVIAIVFAFGALEIVARARMLSNPQVLTAGGILGLGICSMHYTGMAAMKMDGDLRYLPIIFALSVVIAIAASIAALWMMFTLARTSSLYRYLYQVGAALIMGGAISGMHYTGMAASVFIPWANCRYDANQDFTMLAISIAIITSIILAIALIVDFYKKAQTEFQLQNNENKLRSMIDGALDAVIGINQKGLITEWNKQAEHIFGWSYPEAFGRSLPDMIIPPENQSVFYRGLLDGSSPILNRRIEMQAINKESGRFPLELSITVQKLHDGTYHYTVFARDISERKRADENRGLLAAIVESSEDPIISKTLDGVITSWNNGAERLFGYTASEAIGQNINMIIPSDRLAEEKNIIKKLHKGISINHLETVRLNKDGKEIDISLSISPICDASGTIIGASKIVRDITARKKTEAKLAAYTKELEESNRELDDFSYIASHDLKEPLRGLHNFSRFLLEDYGLKLDEHGKSMLSTIAQLTKRMDEQLSALLHYSRLGRTALSIRLTDLNDIVRHALAMHDIKISETGAKIKIATMPTVECDHVRLTEVFQNLIGNALKYNDSTHPEIEIGIKKDHPKEPGKTVYFVKDNGIGIDGRNLEAIFKIFRRLHVESAYGGGTGSGLTITKKIITQHGGRIWAESKGKGYGTVFYFTLAP